MQGQINITDEIVVDGFCGGGGWSTGCELAIGRPVDIGINHDADAIAMHKRNHPFTEHYNENIYEVNPYEAVRGRTVGWAHFSPDCTHFSRAKGGTPVKKSIRGLAWVVTKWAGTVHPRIISMENVPEFLTWGPLCASRNKHGSVMTTDTMSFYDEELGRWKNVDVAAKRHTYVPYNKQQLIPNPRRKGETFKKFIKTMKSLGYECEWKILTASDYGAPTIRKRLFIIFRNDGKPIVWPEPTHGDPDSEAVKKGKLKPWRTAAECIDWSIECPSIFERKKPLAENTLKRIAKGIQKFVIDNPQLFIVQVNHGGECFRGQSIDEPMPTVTAKHGFGIVTPTIMSNNTGNVGASIDAPLPTVTTGNRNYMVAPSIIPVGYGERKGQEPRTHSVEKPLPSIVSTAKHYIVTPTLIQYHGEQSENEVRGQALEQPLQTVDTANRYGLVAAFMSKCFGGNYKGCGSAADEPLHTVTAVDHNALAAVHITQFNNNCIGQKADEPLNTITCGAGHFGEVKAFLIKYYGGESSQSMTEPMHTVTTKDRFGLIQIQGEDYAIVDIGMRMLTPRELYNAQGFPADYEIETDCYGKAYPKTKQVARCGNSVPPPFATALLRANAPEWCGKEIKTMKEFNRMIAV